MFVLVALFAAAPLASAQLLAEVTLTSAIASQLYPSVSFPRGSYRADGPGSARFVAALPDVAGFGDWEVYTATGLVARLQPAFVRELATSFAVAGLFQVDRSERLVDGRTHVRILFSDGSREAIVVVVTDEVSSSVVWAVGRKGTP